MSCCGAYPMPVDLEPRAPRPGVSESATFTLKGWHVLAALIAFFAVIFAINATMIVAAIRTMPGTAVGSAYEASQRFNRRLEAIVAQDHLGWQVDIGTTNLRAGGTVSVEVRDRGGLIVSGLDARVRIGRPAIAGLDRDYILAETVGGRYVAALPPHAPGQWQVALELSRNGERIFTSTRRVLLKE